MLTECNPTLFDFARVDGRRAAAFDGGAITSDAGALLLGETDRAIRLIPAVAAIAPLRFLQFATERPEARLGSRHAKFKIARYSEPTLPMARC